MKHVALSFDLSPVSSLCLLSDVRPLTWEDAASPTRHCQLQTVAWCNGLTQAAYLELPPETVILTLSASLSPSSAKCLDNKYWSSNFILFLSKRTKK